MLPSTRVSSMGFLSLCQETDNYKFCQKFSCLKITFLDFLWKMINYKMLFTHLGLHLFIIIIIIYIFFAFGTEEMIRGLKQVSWERVDVSFQKSRQRYIAHNTIQARILKIVCCDWLSNLNSINHKSS